MNDIAAPPNAARRISTPAASAAEPREDTIVGGAFAAICATVLLAAFMMAFVLSMGHIRPVPGYAVFGSGLFGTVFAAFVVASVNLAITDARRQKHDGHHH